MTTDGWITLGVVALVILMLMRNLAPPDVAMMCGAVLLGFTGVLDAETVFGGFTNKGVVTIAALFIVAAAMRETGALDGISERILGRTQGEAKALLRIGAFVLPTSAFLNNTPVVAMMVPMITVWCRRYDLSPSRFLIPLSYFAILGGACTLIGTSTNIVMDGLMRAKAAEYESLAAAANAADPESARHLGSVAQQLAPIGMFELGFVGLPFALIGLIYLVTVGRRLLPDRKDLRGRHEDAARSYLIDLRIEPDCRLAGQTVEGAELRHLPGLYLVEIVRGNKRITPVRPDEVLHAEDVLTFTGVVSNIVDLERIPGLVPVADESYEKTAGERREKSLVEAVVSATSPILGKTVRDADFRALYNAAIIAVHRGGQRLRGRVGDIVLRNGDTLLLQAGPHFARAHQNNTDFYLVSGVEESHSLRNDRAWVAIGLLVVLIGTMSFGREWVDIPIAAWIAALLLIGTGCISSGVARAAIDWRTLVTIGAAIALGQALDSTDTARIIATGVVSSVGEASPIVLLALIYVLTSLFTECVTTKGSAVLMFPIAVAVAEQTGLHARPFVFAVLFAAVASFVTPLGYQTNLMVYGPGGYKFSDFIKVGLPLNIIFTIIAVLLIPLIWPF